MVRESAPGKPQKRPPIFHRQSCSFPPSSSSRVLFVAYCFKLSVHLTSPHLPSFVLFLSSFLSPSLSLSFCPWEAKCILHGGGGGRVKGHSHVAVAAAGSQPACPPPSNFGWAVSKYREREKKLIRLTRLLLLLLRGLSVCLHYTIPHTEDAPAACFAAPKLGRETGKLGSAVWGVGQESWNADIFEFDLQTSRVIRVVSWFGLRGPSS